MPACPTKSEGLDTPVCPDLIIRESLTDQLRYSDVHLGPFSRACARNAMISRRWPSFLRLRSHNLADFVKGSEVKSQIIQLTALAICWLGDSATSVGRRHAWGRANKRKIISCWVRAATQGSSSGSSSTSMRRYKVSSNGASSLSIEIGGEAVFS